MLNFVVFLYAMLTMFVLGAMRQNEIAGRANPEIVQHFGWGLMVVSLLTSGGAALWLLRVMLTTGAAF
ncbi:hypothetical protein [Sphingomonas quercus]|uniref:Uncharacterized protein n=1 Tax=Sphingomonas quercus TaxID=2842451 RepID=A0ABS6BN48_9SPHN|nr:hypothetical protein [Sphingomonas quercus]MBU3079226.1 hypothetical protein [Sphingomonas quercus]